VQPQRLALKLFATRPIARADLHPFIGVFHRFIQQAAVPGLLIDVADYAHVPDGPGVILIGHEVDYGIDLAGGRTGLLTTRKRGGDAGLPELFRDTLGKALAAARAIEADDAVSIRFAPDALEITVPTGSRRPTALPPSRRCARSSSRSPPRCSAHRRGSRTRALPTRAVS
jgi:hypothetical protein